MEKSNNGNSEMERLLLVLNEFTEQQRELVTGLAKLENIIAAQQARLDEFDKKLDSLKIVFPPADTLPLQSVVCRSMDEIKKAVAEQSRPVIHQKRVLLFPEHNAREYYSVVLRWILYIIIATYSFWLLKNVVDHRIL